MKNFLEKAGLKLLFGTFVVTFVMTMTTNSFADPLSGLVRNNIDGSQTLTGHVPLEVKNATATLKYHASQNINARIIMPLQNQTQLSSLLQDLYDSKSPNFHHFLTPSQFAQQFASSTVDSALVQEFLKKEGISVTGQSANGTVLNATGPVAAFEQAFGLHINYYQKSDGTMFFAPDTDPTIPTILAGKVLAIGGLDNLAKYHPYSHQFSSKTLTKNTVTKAAVGAGPGGNLDANCTDIGQFGSGPCGFLAPNDVKTAYNLNSIPSNGSGQSIALFELDGYSSSDITAYEAQFGLPNVPLQNVLIDGFSGTPDYDPLFGGAAEVTIDTELATAFAPGVSNIFVYEAANNITQAWIDEWSQIAADDKAKIISCSWGEPESDSPTINFDNIIFQQMAAQGQAVFVAAGDNGAYTDGSTLSVSEPASQPYVTAVGISVLTTNSNGTYNSETASTYGGGGISAYLSIPFYQTTLASQAVKAAMVSTTMRNLPDVVLTADPSTCYAFYINGSWAAYWGSSLASPIWASFMSLVNQGLGQNGPLGFVNPLLYQIAQSSSYSNDFHDITTGINDDLMGIGYPAEPGFDDATGLGSFNGLNLYNDLVNQINATQPPSVPVGLSSSIGNNQVVLTWNVSAGATSYIVGRATVSGGPYTTIGKSVAANTYYLDNSVSNNTTYYYVVSAVNAVGQSANSVQISAKPVPPPLSIPSIPIGFSASAGNNQVTLTWTASVGATSYIVGRATVIGGPYTDSTISNNIYTDNSVSNGITYYYVVSAVNAAGQSAYSQQVSATPLPPPLAPINLSASVSNGQVVLTWSFSSASSGILNFNVKRSTVSGGPYVTLYNINTLGFQDNTVKPGITYYYVVSSVNSAGESANSTQVSITPEFLPPSAPVSLFATSGNAQVALVWNGGVFPASGVTSYNVKRATVSGGPYTKIAILTEYYDVAAAPLYNDYPLSNGTTYYYVVSAVNGAGESANSAQVSATPMLGPSEPIGLTATAVSSTVINLTWATSFDDSTTVGYNVYRNGTKVGTSTTTTYSDTGLTASTTYSYTVSAYDAKGNTSAQSSAVSVTTPALVISPDGSVLNVGSSGSLVTSAGTWTFSSALGGGGNVILLNGKQAAGGSAVLLLVYNKGQLYAFNNPQDDWFVWNGSWNLISGDPRPASPPSVPTNITGSAVSFSQINLTWTASTDTVAVAGYNVFRNGTKVGTSTSASYTDTGLTASTTYSYTVSAYDAKGNTSAQSSAVSVTTPALVVSPDGSVLNAGSSGSLVTSAGTWTFSTALGGGGNIILLNGKQAAGGSAVLLLVYNKGQLYAYNSPQDDWFLWNGSWNLISGDPRGSALPSVPTGLTATAASPTVIDLTWTASTDSAGVMGYNVFRNGTQVGISTSASYTDTGLTASTTYSYTVSAYDAKGNTSSQSSAVSVTTPAASISPDGSVLNAGSTGSLVTSAGTWTFSTALGGGGNIILLNGKSAAGGSAVLLLVYNKGQLYAYNSPQDDWFVWDGSWSLVSGDPRVSSAPSVPTNLTASAVSTSQINLSWAASSDSAGVAGYKVFRNGTQVGTSTSTTYSDTGLTASTTYSYTVSAYDAKGNNSSQSTSASAMTLAAQVTETITASAGTGGTISPSGSVIINYGASQTFTVTPNAGYTAQLTVDGTAVALNSSNTYTLSDVTTAHTVAASFNLQTVPPSVPTNLTGSAVSFSQVNLSWTASTDSAGVAGYNVLRNGTQVGTSTTTTYSDTGLTASTTYSYTVSAYDAKGNTSAQSSAISVTTLAVSISPDGSVLNAGSSGSLVTSAGTWTFSTSTGGGGYLILLNGKSAAGGSAVTMLVYNKGQLYVYNNPQDDWFVWNGSWNLVSGDPRPALPPSVPTKLTGSAVSFSQVNLSWTASTDTVAVAGYNVFRNGTKVGTSATTTYSDTGLTASTTYSYTVSAYDAKGNTSAQSSAVSVTTPALVISPDGSVLNAGTGGSLVTSAGTWTFSTTKGGGGYLILLNGRSAAGGSAVTMLVYNKGQLYVYNNPQDDWFVWNGSWNLVSGDPRAP